MQSSANNTMNAGWKFNMQLFALEGEGDPGAVAPVAAEPQPVAVTNPGPDPVVQPPVDPAATTDPVASAERNADGTFKTPELSGAPETYADFTLQEGMTYDKEAAAQFGVIAKAQNLTQAQAQALVDHYAGTVKANQQAWGKTIQDWTAESEKIHGTLGCETAKAALDRFEAAKDPDFVKFLADSGLSNHPKFIQIFKEIGEKTSAHLFVESAGSMTGAIKAGDKTPGRYYESMKNLKQT